MGIYILLGIILVGLFITFWFLICASNENGSSLHEFLTGQNNKYNRDIQELRDDIKKLEKSYKESNEELREDIRTLNCNLHTLKETHNENCDRFNKEISFIKSNIYICDDSEDKK